jgi:flagellar motility protein MotE (MotC chaperone)
MEAVKTLLSLQEGSVSNNVRLGAARAILEQGTRLRELADLEERLAALEQRMEDKESGVTQPV